MTRISIYGLLPFLCFMLSSCPFRIPDKKFACQENSDCKKGSYCHPDTHLCEEVSGEDIKETDTLLKDQLKDKGKADIFDGLDGTGEDVANPDIVDMGMDKGGIDTPMGDADGVDISIIDKDGDSYPPPEDCNDDPVMDDPTCDKHQICARHFHPGASEGCCPRNLGTPDGNDLTCGTECLARCDKDCDGKASFCQSGDLDGDNFTPVQGDCNDFRSEIHPGAMEPCCSRTLMGRPQEEQLEACDFNCNDAVTFCAEKDNDNDGFVPPEDCDDGNPLVYPNAPDKCGNGIDEDCKGGDLSCDGITEKDGDGFALPTDCDDMNKDIHPFAVEICNGIDDDCEGVTDEGNPVYVDDMGNPIDTAEGTWVGGSSCGSSDTGECRKGTWACARDETGAASAVCHGEIKPAIEVCDDKDNDCNGLVDDDPTLQQTCRCYLGQNTPAEEVCNGIDDDCDTRTDECPPGEACIDGVCLCPDSSQSFFMDCSVGTCENGVCMCPSGLITLSCDPRTSDHCGSTPEPEGCRCGEGGPCTDPKICVNGQCQ